MVPEGTVVTWKLNTKTQSVSSVFEDNQKSFFSLNRIILSNCLRISEIWIKSLL
jgi:hypothetical protein